jgi:hypothetical protein
MLTLLNSVFTIGDNLILTLNGPINNSSASIQGGVFSNLILSGSLPTTLFPTASLYNLTIDRSGNIILNGDVDVQGILSLTTGLFDLTNHKLKIHQPIVGNQDNLITSSVSNFEISGSATNMNIGAAENIRISNINNLYVSNTNPSGIALNGDLKLNGLLMVNTASKFSINSGKKLTVNGPIILNDTVCLIVKSDSTGTGSLIDHGITYIFPASAKVERYISGNKFHMISLPISNTIQGGTQPGQTGNVFLNCSLDNYDENLNTWYGLTQNDNITPDMGYITQYYYLGNAPDYKTIKFSGNLNTGSKSFLIKNTNQGYNLLPNPYPSSVNWDNPLGWERSGLVINSGGYDIWIWNPNPGINNWGTYNSGTHIGTNDVTNHITVGQSFFVQALFFNSILTVNDNAREHSDQIFLKNASQLNNILKLKISNGISSDEAVVYFDMLNQLNTGSLKWMSMAAESPNLYMPKNNQNYAVNILPSLNSNTVIPLNLAAGINGNYSLTWQHTDSFESNMNILLEDIQQHVFTDLRNNSVYTFNANIADNPSRFLLHFNNSINNIPIEKTDQTLIYAYGNTIYVSYTDTRDASIELYNVSGQLLYERTINNSRHEIPLNLPNGIFFVKFSGQQKSTYQKIVIQK